MLNRTHEYCSVLIVFVHLGRGEGGGGVGSERAEEVRSGTERAQLGEFLERGVL